MEEPEIPEIEPEKSDNRKRETDDALSSVLEDMKSQGVNGAIVRSDGVLVHSTIAITDSGAQMLASLTNTSDALMRRINDRQREVELTFDNLILVIIPIKDHLFAGAVKSRDQKKTIRDFAAKAKELL